MTQLVIACIIAGFVVGVIAVRIWWIWEMERARKRQESDRWNGLH